MSKVPFKAQAISRDLAVRLKNRIAGLSIQQDVDTDRFPTLQCKIGAKSVWVRLSTDFERSEDDGHVDSLGLAQTVYSPHKAEIIQEDSAGVVGVDPSTVELRAQVLAECSKLGMKLIVREGEGVQDDTSFAAADAAGTTTVAVIKSNDINPLTQQM